MIFSSSPSDFGVQTGKKFNNQPKSGQKFNNQPRYIIDIITSSFDEYGAKFNNQPRTIVYITSDFR